MTSPTGTEKEHTGPAVRVRDLSLWYTDFQALMGVDLDVEPKRVTSLIGPSGCGKSTLLRCLNRINERIPGVRTEGKVEIHGHDAYAPEVDLVSLRRLVGMVFQRPNPLPLSVRDNVLFGYRIHEAPLKKPSRAEVDQILEETLRAVLLWDSVKDRLNAPAIRLSLEEQQKLCIARLLPVKPHVLLMDEPCSALDPEGTSAVEDLIWKLREEYTIVLVTHSMAQARRASDRCAFMLLGELVEVGNTADLFVTPKDKRTADYIEGRYG